MRLLLLLLKLQLFCWLFSAGSAFAVELTGKHISICEDDAEWHPMTYYLRDGKRKTRVVTGYSVELIDKILRKHKITWDIALLPWSRCLHEVKKGNSFQMLLNAVKTEQRSTDYLLTDPHFVTSKQYFYSKQAYPDGLVINSKEDLSRYTLGGVYGYDHTVYGIKEEQITYRAKSYPHLIQMLYLGRFDLFLAGSGIVPWYRKTQPGLIDDQKLGYAPLKGFPKTPFHMMVTKQNEVGPALLELINHEMQLMQQNGEWQKLQQKYLR